MIQKILDLHIHSKYSRACSRDLELPNIAAGCVRKGIDIVSTGDFTHPKWFEHIKESLVEDGEGGYRLMTYDVGRMTDRGRFILGTELSCIKKHKGETRRLHLCVFAPNIETVENFNQKKASIILTAIEIVNLCVIQKKPDDWAEFVQNVKSPW